MAIKINREEQPTVIELSTYNRVSFMLAMCEVNSYLEDNGIELDDGQFLSVVEKFMFWKNRNNRWYEAIGDIVREVSGK